MQARGDLRFFRLVVMAVTWLITACSGEDGRMVYVPLEPETRSRLPQAPHVELIRARPSEEMIKSHSGEQMRFRLLDKRTLQIKLMDIPVGQPWEGPWGGWMHAISFVPDLLLREGQAVHGPEGHVNPAVWVMINDGEGVPLHESWLFSRDTAQTAWDHPRYDISFVGPVHIPPPAMTTKTAAPAANKKKEPRRPLREESPPEELPVIND